MLWAFRQGPFFCLRTCQKRKTIIMACYCVEWVVNTFYVQNRIDDCRFYRCKWNGSNWSNVATETRRTIIANKNDIILLVVTISHNNATKSGAQIVSKIRSNKLSAIKLMRWFVLLQLFLWFIILFDLAFWQNVAHH